MNIPITQVPSSYTADIQTTVKGGIVTYEAIFKCPHENIRVVGNRVLCYDCNGKQLSPEQETSLLMSYEDARAAQQEDELQQS